MRHYSFKFAHEHVANSREKKPAAQPTWEVSSKCLHAGESYTMSTPALSTLMGGLQTLADCREIRSLRSVSWLSAA